MKLFNIPFIVASLVSLHVTTFAVAMQMDLLIFDSDASKMASWGVAFLTWYGVYRFWPSWVAR